MRTQMRRARALVSILRRRYLKMLSLEIQIIPESPSHRPTDWYKQKKRSTSLKGRRLLFICGSGARPDARPALFVRCRRSRAMGRSCVAFG